MDFVYDDNTARQALEKMKNHGFTAVPVIDREGRYVKTLQRATFCGSCLIMAFRICVSWKNIR